MTYETLFIGNTATAGYNIIIIHTLYQLWLIKNNVGSTLLTFLTLLLVREFCSCLSR